MNNYSETAHDLAKKIMDGNGDDRRKLGELTVCASVFIGAAAAVMANISRQKTGPELDIAGWSREITNMVVQTIAKDQH